VLIRIFLFAVMAYILIRLIQVTMRILSSRRDQGDDALRSGSSAHKPGPEQYKDIRDADFEDITPKRGDGKDESASGTKQPSDAL
jgi:hypothetical protein